MEDRVVDVGRSVADNAGNQQPIGRSRRVRKPNSMYDPVVNDLDSEEVKGIELRGMRKSWKGEGGSIGHNKISPPEGEGELQESYSIYICFRSYEKQ